MVWKALPSNTIFFDIETGGFSGYRNSVFSVAYQDMLGKGAEVFAYPEEGTKISQWSRTQVWSRIERDSIKKAIRIQQEKEILSHFLNVLESAEEGTTLAGWNIGYQAIPQNPDDPRLRGFDISMLMTRAERHGLAGRYEKALSRLQVRDLGQEWAARIAEIVSKPQYEGRVDQKLYESAKGYQKALYSEGMEGASYEARARWASTSGTKVAGWSQEITHFLKTGQRYEAHGAMEDVTALREMLSYNTIEDEEKFVELWNRVALRDKLVKQAKSTTKGTTLKEIQDLARAAGIQVEGKGGITEEIEQLAKASGASLEDVAMGRGMPERWSKVVGRVSAARPAASSFGRIAEGVVSHIGQHKVGYGIAVGAAALYAIGPLSLFSGKDDAHNTIEGMQHGGMAERLRQAMTDFGSGYQGITNTIRRWYAQKDEEEREKNRETVKKNAPTPRVQHAQVHAKRGKAYWITRTTTRPNRISGRDDDYNTIEGMPEKGSAGRTRKYRTDFGSGYQGPNPWLQPDYNEKQEVAHYKLMRASQLGKSVSEMVAYFTTKEQPSEYLLSTASAGTALHLVEQTKKAASGEADSVEQLVYDPLYKITGHIDLTRADSGAPVDIKSLAPERMERIRTKGAFPKHVSQLNFYMAMLGQDKGYLEYINRENVDDRQIIEVPFSQSKLDEDLARLARAREIVEEGIASGKWKEDELPKGASLETLRVQAEEEKGTLEKNAGRLDYLEKVYSEEMEYFHKLDAERRKSGRKTVSYPPRFSGKDDNYNTIEGLKHGGFAEQMRRSMTDFGSGWMVPAMMILDDAVPAYLRTPSGQALLLDVKNEFSGRDDEYNSIEGMPHGWFGRWRKRNTDFGSGLQKIGSWIAKQAKNFAKLPGEFAKAYKAAYAEQVRGGVSAGEVFQDIVDLTGQEITSREGSKFYIGEEIGRGGFGKVYNAIESGTGRRAIYKQAIAHAETKPTGLEHALAPRMFVNTPDLTAAQAEGLLDLTKARYEMMSKYAPGTMDIEHEASMQRMAYDLMPDIVPEVLGTTEAGFFQEMAGEAIRPQDIGNAEGFIRNKLPELAKRGVIHFDPSLTNVVRNYDTGQFKLIDFGFSVPTASVINRRPALDVFETMAAKAITPKETAYKLQQQAFLKDHPSKMEIFPFDRPNEATGKVANFKVLTEGEIQSPGKMATDGVIPDKQESYNSFTGMPHTSPSTVSERRKHGFKSKWDMLIKKFGSEVLGGAEFQEALQSAAKKSLLGTGKRGEVWKMVGKFRDEEFEFARKVGKVTEHEAEMTRAFSHDFSPTVYGFKPGQMDMELFQGKTLLEHMKAQGKELPEIEAFAEKIEQNINRQVKGYTAADVHSENVMMIPKEGGGHQIGIIDLGWWEKEGTPHPDFNQVSEGIVSTMKTSIEDRATLQRDATATLFNNARAGHGHNTGKKF